MSCPFHQTAELNPALLPLDWLLGKWQSDEPGEGSFSNIAHFRYTEALCFSHVGQPVINFMFNACDADTKKPMHRECGFIRMQPGTNRVAFIIAQNSVAESYASGTSGYPAAVAAGPPSLILPTSHALTCTNMRKAVCLDNINPRGAEGLVEIEEGEITGQQVNLQSQALARTSFAKEPHVKEISRVFQLRPDGKLEQTVSMATDSQPLMQHLHITYHRAP